MATTRNGDLIITVKGAGEGDQLRRFQESLIVAIEKVATSFDADERINKIAVYNLCDLLREAMLDPAQTNVGLVKKGGGLNNLPGNSSSNKFPFKE